MYGGSLYPRAATWCRTPSHHPQYRGASDVRMTSLEGRSVFSQSKKTASTTGRYVWILSRDACSQSATFSKAFLRARNIEQQVPSNGQRPRKALRGGIEKSILTDFSGNMGDSRQMLTKTRKRLQERGRDTPTKSLLWLTWRGRLHSSRHPHSLASSFIYTQFTRSSSYAQPLDCPSVGRPLPPSPTGAGTSMNAADPQSKSVEGVLPPARSCRCRVDATSSPLPLPTTAAPSPGLTKTTPPSTRVAPLARLSQNSAPPWGGSGRWMPPHCSGRAIAATVGSSVVGANTWFRGVLVLKARRLLYH